MLLSRFGTTFFTLLVCIGPLALAEPPVVQIHQLHKFNDGPDFSSMAAKPENYHSPQKLQKSHRKLDPKLIDELIQKAGLSEALLHWHVMDRHMLWIAATTLPLKPFIQRYPKLNPGPLQSFHQLSNE